MNQRKHKMGRDLFAIQGPSEPRPVSGDIFRNCWVSMFKQTPVMVMEIGCTQVIGFCVMINFRDRHCTPDSFVTYCPSHGVDHAAQLIEHRDVCPFTERQANQAGWRRSTLNMNCPHKPDPHHLQQPGRQRICCIHWSRRLHSRTKCMSPQSSVHIRCTALELCGEFEHHWVRRTRCYQSCQPHPEAGNSQRDPRNDCNTSASLRCRWPGRWLTLTCTREG